MATTVDLVIIGSGGAAFAAAIRAVELGQRVAMVERGTVGGTCVNTGCVPSKALLAAAEARHVAEDADHRFPGITTNAGPVDMPAVIAGKDGLVTQLRTERYLDVADAHGWRTMTGEARFDGTAEDPFLRVTTPEGTVESVHAKHYLVATGSHPWVPPIDGLADTDHLTSTTVMDLGVVPASLLVLGGGYVALEQAQLLARLGSQVTMLVRSRLASHEEPEVASTMGQVLTDEGIRLVDGAHVTRVVRDPGTGKVVATATVAGEQRVFEAEHLLLAVGRRPTTARLNLPQVGVSTGHLGHVVVTDELTSTNPRVWAAGDVTGHPAFVYVAARHGTLAVENAFTGAHRSVDYSHLPRVTFTSPSIGAVGLTEQQALTAGIRCDCRVVPLHLLSRAQVNRDTRGFIKMVIDADTSTIIGITAVAKDAGELAAAGVHVLGKTLDEVIDSWAPYLTITEGIRIAAKAFTTDISTLSCCA
ncbi:mercury(II) reductase [Ornithinibacter aureus]|uniref:Mercuric reductase n=1 Tax=Ornithinibacter aureus TaxID=622664 RepID=A0ABP8JYW5_9MICO|nr:mercury(II) reductase [Ornithinibacter aureus]KAF0834341.1 mercuric reductase [Ornithinibacter aureus]